MEYRETPIEDPAILGRVLSVLDGMVKRMEDGGRIEIMDGTTILGLLRLFGGEFNQTQPEQTVEQTLLAVVEAALKTKRASEFVQGSRRLSLMLRHHLDVDDTTVDRDPKASGQPEIQAYLSSLEQKYVRGNGGPAATV